MEFTRETESPDAYHFWTAASLISAATKRQVFFQMNQFQIYPNLYVILVGPSGARKSIASGIGIELATASGLRKFSDKITGAALIKDLSNATEKRIEGDTKSSKIQLCSPVIIYSSELGVFMGPDAYGSGVIADLTDLYDCPGKWEKKTISRDSEIIVAPYVTMLAATTPQTLKDCIPTSAVGQGFTSRILFIWASGRRKRVPIPPWGVEYDTLKSLLIKDLASIGNLRGQFKFARGGFEAYKKYYLAAPEPEDEFEDERLRGYASRKSIHLLKLAMVLSVADREDLEITEKEISGGLDALQWMESGLPQVFAGHGGAATSQDVVRVFNQVRNSRGGIVSQQELTKRNYSNLSSTELNFVIETLKQGGAITEVVGNDPRTKKPGVLYKILDQEFISKIQIKAPKIMKPEEE